MKLIELPSFSCPFCGNEFIPIRKVEQDETEKALTWAYKKINELYRELAIAKGEYDPRYDDKAVHSGERVWGAPNILSPCVDKKDGKGQTATSARCDKRGRETVSVRGEEIRPDEVSKPFHVCTVGWKFMDSDGWISSSYDSKEAAEKARTKYKEKYNR